MKKMILIVMMLVAILFLPGTSHAETYQCAYSFEGDPRMATHERMSRNVFLVRSGDGSIKVDAGVLFENDIYLILGVMRDYKGSLAYNVSIIRKDTLMFRSTAIVDPNNKSDRSAIVEGNCLLEQ